MEIIPTNEFDGIVEFKCLIKEFLSNEEGSSPEVRKYISAIAEDDKQLLIYLKGRKYRAKHAWETLKRYAEVRFIEYPEVFPEIPPKEIFQLQRNGVIALLKARDKLGRRIFYYHTGKWDPSEISMEKMTAMAAFFVDKILLDEDAVNNGIVLIKDCAGTEMKHYRAYSFHCMMRLLNIFYYANPLKVKGAYYLNVPILARSLYKIMKPFLSKKLKERLFLLPSGDKLEALHETLPSYLIPKFLGGLTENDDAIDFDFFPPSIK